MKRYLLLSVPFLILLAGCSTQNPTPTEVHLVSTKTPSTTSTAALSIKELSTSTAILTSTPTEVSPGTILFEENFEDGTIQRFSYVSDNWVISTDETGNKVFEVDTTSETNVATQSGAGIGFGSTDWTNYVIEYRVKMLNGNANAWLNFRSTMNNQNYYVEWLSLQYQTIDLQTNLDGKGWEEIVDHAYPVAIDTWYKIKVEAQGSSLQIWINDELVLKVNDARISSGGFDLGVMPDTHAQFDDIRVTSLGNTP